MYLRLEDLTSVTGDSVDRQNRLVVCKMTFSVRKRKS